MKHVSIQDIDVVYRVPARKPSNQRSLDICKFTHFLLIIIMAESVFRSNKLSVSIELWRYVEEVQFKKKSLFSFTRVVDIFKQNFTKFIWGVIWQWRCYFFLWGLLIEKRFVRLKKTYAWLHEFFVQGKFLVMMISQLWRVMSHEVTRKPKTEFSYRMDTKWFRESLRKTTCTMSLKVSK